MKTCKNHGRKEIENEIHIMKICKNHGRKEIENQIHMIFSCDRYDNIQRKAFNDINEVDNIKLQIANKMEKLKVFFIEDFLKARNIFGQFLMRAFESR